MTTHAKGKHGLPQSGYGYTTGYMFLAMPNRVEAKRSQTIR